ncbi:MAG: gamma-glutamylcyclotransferase [Alphaproteobacteria bacterium]|nr:gamma-glutamylcyclotransferase [Alphaproteobacteria bacterium]MBM3639921.1 gamma-glutamylcyclotransferase [Alphaproteobacteria bacterium]
MRVPLYFAYGSNMDASAMAARCPRSRLVGRGRLAGYRTILMASGFVSVAPDRRMSVHGVLWDVAVGDVAALDRYEDVTRGLYAKKNFPILRKPFGSVRALTYVGARPDLGAAPRGYFDGVIAAARAQALPGDYIDYLSGLLSIHQSGRRP